MNYGLLTHEAANSEKFRSGFPGGWPYVKPVELGENDKLPAELPSPPWIVVTAEELRQRLEMLTPLVNAWTDPEPEDVTARRQQIVTIRNKLRDLRDFQGRMTLDDITAGLRQIAATLLIMIEEERVNLK